MTANNNDVTVTEAIIMVSKTYANEASTAPRTMTSAKTVHGEQSASIKSVPCTSRYSSRAPSIQMAMKRSTIKNDKSVTVVLNFAQM